MEIYCTNCTNPKPLKGKKVKIKYDVSGLDYLTIDGVIEHKCPRCGEVYRYYGNIEKLNHAIAEFIAKKVDHLQGQEVRFIRKYLGYNTKMFATEILKIDVATLSRIENDKIEHSSTLDNFIKYLALSKNPDRDYEIHELLLKKQPSFSNLILKPRKGKWLIEALA